MMRRWSLAGLLAAGALVLGTAGLYPSVALGAGDLNRAQCPNEGLSGFSRLLPDCRAYEMVTPPYKEGYPLEPLVSGDPEGGEGYSLDGNQLFAGSFANLADVSGDGESLEGALYQDSRTADGWELSPLNPSSSAYALQRLVDVEPDSGVSLWEMHTPEQPATVDELYIRSANGVSFSPVGPLTPPSQAVGEPSDVGTKPFIGVDGFSDEAGEIYSHLVMEVVDSSGRWEFDHTQGNGKSLYEYTGLGNARPTPVGVFGEKGSLALTGVVDGKPAGFECGVELGAPGETYNAISRNGEAIFYTPVLKQVPECSSAPSAVAPAVAEVWVRVHGSVRVPEAAETVDVSARSPSECTGACAASAESGKLFEGASENGEKAFFTSTQQLLNSGHQDPDTEDNAAAGSGCAGTSGEGGCNLYEYDFAAPAGHRLKVIAPGAEVLGVARISEDGSRVYFVARGVLSGEANAHGAHAQPGQPNLYVYNTVSERLEPHGFIATLDGETDGQDWSAFDERPVQAVPADGRFLVFASAASGLTPDDKAQASQLFEYDAQSGELVRISKAEDEEAGFAENGNAAESRIKSPQIEVVAFKSHDQVANIAETEEAGVPVVTVAFESAGRLSARASAAQPTAATPTGCTSVYEYRSAGAIEDGGVYLVSGGRDTQLYKGTRCGARFVDMNASGENILFHTADSLLPSDTDGGQVDLYDARVDGGFSVPSSEAAACGGGETCTGGPPAASLTGGSPQSALQAAEGNNIVPGPAKQAGTAVKRSAGGALKRALRACRARRSARRRASCEAAARRRYGSGRQARRSSRRKAR